MDELAWQPSFVSAVFEPNPAKVGQAVTLRVKVIDALGGRQPEAWHAGDVYSGEV